MQIYHYSPGTGEYLKTSIAQIDPLESETQGEDVFLIPACATEIAPPDPGANKAVVFESGAWSEVDDYRGEWYLATGEKIEIIDLGISPPAGATDSPPLPSLDDVKASKITEVKAVAQSKVNNIIPQGWRQLNSLARSIELEKLARVGTITAAEQTEMDALQAKWDRIKAIRTASDVIESEIDALTTKEAVEGYDISGSTHWPE